MERTSTDRRTFLRTTALAGGALAAGAGGAGALTGDPGSSGTRAATGPGPVGRRASEPKRILILGGTGFIGPHEVRLARERGHTLTLFNRGRTAPGLFPGVEQLRGDRDDDLEALKGREWDAVVDNHATLPRWVRQSAGLLKDAAEQYVFISTISVYADTSRPGMDEDAPTATLDDPTVEEVTGQTYGGLKALAEREAERAFPGRTTVIRPGLIVGPGDPTDRFTYWPVRVDRGGDVLAPGDGTDPVQFIDARDLAAFVLRTVEDGATGVFNATGPESPLTMAGMLHGMRAVTTGPIRFVWVDPAFLEEQGVRPWADMPVWIPDGPDTAGFARVSIRRALDAGLDFRPLAETVRDTLDWHATRPDEERERWRAGITAERERELLEAWQERQGTG